jgi:hypothetical protein
MAEDPVGFGGVADPGLECVAEGALEDDLRIRLPGWIWPVVHRCQLAQNPDPVPARGPFLGKGDSHVKRSLLIALEVEGRDRGLHGREPDLLTEQTRA